MKICVIIPAAGLGKRFSESQPTGALSIGSSKIEQDLAGRPVFLHALELFVNNPLVSQIILAVHPDRVDDFNLRWGDKLSFHGVRVVSGGTIERWESVLNALQVVDATCTHVAVHDAARPLTSLQLIDRVFEAANHHQAVIPGLPVRATLKRVIDSESQPRETDPLDAILGNSDKVSSIPTQQVDQTIDRSDLVEAQTPQVFEKELLLRAYQRVEADLASGGLLAGLTDDAGCVERLGEPVYLVPGESGNWKITDSNDLEMARVVMEATRQAETARLGRKRLFADDDDE